MRSIARRLFIFFALAVWILLNYVNCATVPELTDALQPQESNETELTPVTRSPRFAVAVESDEPDPDEDNEFLQKPSVVPEDCGESKVNPFTRIVNGTAAKAGEFPWMGLIFMEDGMVSRGGGALVSKRHVVTAAHCVAISSRKQVFRTLPGRLFLVRLAEHDVSSKNELEFTIDIRVKENAVHPEYNPNTIVHDIALLTLSKDVQFGMFIQPICLPFGKFPLAIQLEEKTAVVTGWGHTSFAGRSSDVLQKADVNITIAEECRDAYEGEVEITHGMICAGDGSKDACQNDSGGPLNFVHEEKYYIVGVVSFGRQCGVPGIPGVYTRVSSHLKWMSELMR